MWKDAHIWASIPKYSFFVFFFTLQLDLFWDFFLDGINTYHSVVFVKYINTNRQYIPTGSIYQHVVNTNRQYIPTGNKYQQAVYTNRQ